MADYGQKDGKKCLLTAALYLSREFLGENISPRELSDSCGQTHLSNVPIIVLYTYLVVSYEIGM